MLDRSDVFVLKAQTKLSSLLQQYTVKSDEWTSSREELFRMFNKKTGLLSLRRCVYMYCCVYAPKGLDSLDCRRE